jgi:2'-5' RNA ligase
MQLKVYVTELNGVIMPHVSMGGKYKPGPNERIHFAVMGTANLKDLYKRAYEKAQQRGLPADPRDFSVTVTSSSIHHTSVQ